MASVKAKSSPVVTPDRPDYTAVIEEKLNHVAHDLKNAVANIMGSAQLLLDGLDGEDDQTFQEDAREFLPIILGEAERLGSMIDRFRSSD